MREGPWHQCGDRSQKVALELLQHDAGVGVVLSPKDLSFAKAVEYAEEYKALDAEVLLDLQFFNPQYSNNNIASYPTSDYRTSVSELRRIGDAELSSLAAQIQISNEAVDADGVISPAVVYQASNPGVAELNARLFTAAKAAGDELGTPTYATVVLGRSVIASQDAMDEALSYATALDADGWYFGFEFEPERIPSSREAVYRCCYAGLTLACTGKPVLHAYAGPLALLSSSFGATGTAIGHSQNLWRFSPSRWQPPSGQGGGGAAPPRYFSSALWGTIVHPDETVQLSRSLADRVITPSPFSGDRLPPENWSRWDSNKHLIYSVCVAVGELTETLDPQDKARAVQERLRNAVDLYQDIIGAGIFVRDGANAYQENWAAALDDLMEHNQDNFDYLSLL